MKLKKLFIKFKKHKILSSMVLVILLSIITINMYNNALLKASEFMMVPVCNKYLKSNSLINETDIKYVNIPSHVVLDSVITDSNEIIGKYVDTYDSLSKDSLFYNDVLVDDQHINNAYLFELANGEVAISIDSDVKSSYSNSILVGQFIDLYYLGKSDNSFDNDDLLVYGQIVSNARVIAVKDKNGENIDAESELNTNVVVVALNQEDAHIIQLAKAMGEVSLVISYDNINKSNTNDYYNIEKIIAIIEQRSIDVEALNSGISDENEYS
jgi:Flp pilus assembly protein CpaB